MLKEIKSNLISALIGLALGSYIQALSRPLIAIVALTEKLLMPYIPQTLMTELTLLGWLLAVGFLLAALYLYLQLKNLNNLHAANQAELETLRSELSKFCKDFRAGKI
jgi:predicted membrane protein